MTEQIMKLLKSSNEEDNVIGLMLFKKIKGATHKKLCRYLHDNRDDSERHFSFTASKYFKNSMYSSRPHLRFKWKRLIK